MTVLLDTGPWVALLSRNDTHQQWAVEQFRSLPPPMLSCEAGVAETCFLLKRSGFDPALALQFIKRDVVQLPFALQEQIASVSSLFKRHENVSASIGMSMIYLGSAEDGKVRARCPWGSVTSNKPRTGHHQLCVTPPRSLPTTQGSVR